MSSDDPRLRADAHAGHSHGVTAGADRRYLSFALTLIVAFLVFEVVVALLADSLVLLADAGHMLSDAVALGAALWAMHLAAKPARGVWTYGFKRAEILSAAGNGITLVAGRGHHHDRGDPAPRPPARGRGRPGARRRSRRCRGQRR